MQSHPHSHLNQIAHRLRAINTTIIISIIQLNPAMTATTNLLKIIITTNMLFDSECILKLAVDNTIAFLISLDRHYYDQIIVTIAAMLNKIGWSTVISTVTALEEMDYQNKDILRIPSNSMICSY